MSGEPLYAQDTIVAAATAPGTGGVAIVRISGPAANDIGRAMLGALPAPRIATVGAFVDQQGEVLDEGLALWFPRPASFTGEDVLELHGHGGPLVVANLIAATIELGARRAEPGEFSRRAFLNDKLDLAQAEAVADLIASGTRQAARAALRTLSGEFSNAVNELLEQLIRLRLHVEAAIDFPEEEIDFLSDQALLGQIDQVRDAFASLAARANAGRVLRDGMQVVIVGRPNAGKSSLLNVLSGADTAIVTEVAGTTRDILRERIDIDGLLVELVDTAGLREDPDQIEAEGIRRARAALKNADAVLWVRDASAAGKSSAPPEPLPTDVPVLQVYNKMDLPNARRAHDGDCAVYLSAKTGEGTDALRTELKRLAGLEDIGEGSFTARQRHLDALLRARQNFDSGVGALQKAGAGEILAEELRLAQEALGEITGRFTSDDLLGRIFSEFCIGK
ncbi:MAG: tRNA uridine-5-carboxymethylaminomethyl(34) synthesis GTPase MnmE [Woeseia sp.]|nr:tRNA uridine-5-carboxymethylaminomethyl(34) synthesis GTPase MnmE [Woeseia sp.]MBT8097397.1 tRNA uridine-5-carboxymethylaminomethyl(34) synthesis GTPase MnmE [Woeseia sp.]NNE61163.1 tRNA uridine-5-carboxymethylaminomethyl(34) synthesis GTPase MnmE [Woeseia sp.]NNL53862.1 tRNA uridine-5-carboxymethylaminomethyl(34) synthesis GTPase MnmE [Woeseia sp.]